MLLRGPQLFMEWFTAMASKDTFGLKYILVQTPQLAEKMRVSV